MSKIINIFGGPGIGKSSIAAGITYKLKKKHISCNNPYEFPKILAWDQNLSATKDQLFVLANQHRGITQSYGKVDYIVVDSPILFSLIYKTWYDSGYPSNFYGDSFDQMVLDIHGGYDNINILLERSEGNYNEGERYQNIEESKKIDLHCKKILEQNNIHFHTVKVGKDTVKKILKLL